MLNTKIQNKINNIEIYCNNCKSSFKVNDDAKFPLFCKCGKSSEDGVLWVIA